MLSGTISSSLVSVVVQPTTTISTIALSTVFRLGLVPLFNRSGHYTCEVFLSIPTIDGFYTSRTYLRCCHVSGNIEIVLGSDWVVACGAALCDDGSRLLDPSQSAVASLPEGYHWTPNEGKIKLDFNMTVQ